MAIDRRQKLIDLGADALADALIDLAVHSDKADNLVERMIAAPEENIQRFKKKLSGLKHSGRFIDWRGAADFAHELEMLLQDVKAGVNDPFIGVELVDLDFGTWIHQSVSPWYSVFEETGHTICAYNQLEKN